MFFNIHKTFFNITLINGFLLPRKMKIMLDIQD